MYKQFLIAIGWTLFCSAILDAQINQSYSKPLNLVDSYGDDFSKDSRSSYGLSGSKLPEWKPGSISLFSGGVLQKSVGSGPRFKLTIDLHFPELKEDGETSELKLWFDMSESGDTCLWFRQKREQGKIQSAIFMAGSDKDWKQNSLDFHASFPLTQDNGIQNGKWSINYQHGSWRLAGPEGTIPHFGFSAGNITNIANFVLVAEKGEYLLNSVHLQKSEKVDFNFTESGRKKFEAGNQATRKTITLFRSQKFRESIRIGKQAVNLRLESLGKFHPEYSKSCRNLALIHLETGNIGKAFEFYKKSLEVDKETLGQHHPDFAQTLIGIGRCYRRTRDFAKAQACIKQAMEIQRKVLGKSNAEYARSLNYLGLAFQGSNDYTNSIRCFEESAEITKKVSGVGFNFAVCLYNLGDQYNQIGQNLNAKSQFLQAKKIVEDQRQQNTPFYAAIIYQLGVVADKLEDYDAAEKLLKQSVAQRESLSGKDSQPYIASLASLANLYLKKNEFEVAEKLFIQVAETYETKFNSDHVNYSRHLCNMARLYRSKGEVTKAESLYLKAKSKLSNSVGTAHQAYIECGTSLARLYAGMGKPKKAISVLEQVIEECRDGLGEKHPELAGLLKNLGDIHESTNNFTRAESLYLQAISIWKSDSALPHLFCASGLNSLAQLYRDTGNYVEAEKYFLEAIELVGKVKGKSSFDYLACVANLSGVYKLVKDYDKSDKLLLEVLEFQKDMNQPILHARTLSALGSSFQDQKKLEAAEKCFRQALDVLSQLPNKGPNIDEARVVTLLANVTSAMGRPSEAKSLVEKSIKTQEKHYGRKHPDVAVSLFVLARIHSDQAEYGQAATLAKEALSIMTELYGEENPEVLTSQTQLAGILERQGKFEEAKKLLTLIVQNTRKMIDRDSLVQSEELQRKYSRAMDYRYSAFVSNALRLEEQAENVWKETSNWKGIELLRQKRSLTLTNRSETKEFFEALKEIRNRLSVHLRRDPSIADWSKTKDRLKADEEKLEKELARLIAKLGDVAPLTEQADIELPDKTALVNFRKFVFYDPKVIYSDEVQPNRHYLALIKSSTGISMVDLGSADTIDRLIDQWRGPIEYANQNQRAITGSEMTSMELAGRKLKQLLWKPLEGHLESSELILVSPDGNLGRFPLIALPGKTPGSYLLEEKKLVYIPVPSMLRGILSRQPKRFGKDTRSLLVGDIDYGKTTAASAGSIPVQTTLASRNGRILRGLQFTSLPNTLAELQGIAQYSPNARNLTGRNASEAQIRDALPSVDLVHFATHGFFQSPSQFTKVVPDSDVSNGMLNREEQQFQVLTENPNFLSGLALANANQATNETTDNYGTRQGGNDGILYSAEIAMMPMNHVELAVLSACETSLGTGDNPGEGLIGIQRAFQVAGAKSTVASYWKVDDSATQLLMNKFYDNLFTYHKKVGNKISESNLLTIRIDALRDAQLWMLNNSIIASATNRGAPVDVDPRKIKPKPSQNKGIRTHPRYWAAFMLSGDWR